MSDFVILTDQEAAKEVTKKKFCYWTVADGRHGKMMETTIASARAVGVKEDFHVWSDKPVKGAIHHDCGNFDKHLYLFKFKFLKEEVQKLDYDYFIFLDADNYFVRNPGDILSIMGSSPVFVCMENDCTDLEKMKRKDWWGCPIDRWGKVLRDNGVTSSKVYNTNAGFWIVSKGIINHFYDIAMDFWNKCHKDYGFKNFTEEPALAYAGHMLAKNDMDKQTLPKTCHIWASDWTGVYSGRIPDGKPWAFEDYMSGVKQWVNPAIVHAMRSKDAMVALAESNHKLEKFPGGFWTGHQMLGDVIGFVAAAHIYSVKIGKPVKVWFQESRKDILKYFEGVEWVNRDSIPEAIDCGINPSKEEWKNMNGVKRFYKYMDPTFEATKSFDVHMTGGRIEGKKLIGLITHANTQGDIPRYIVDEMVAEARAKYPEHTIVAIGNMDNNYVPAGVTDWRQSTGGIQWIVDTVRSLDLLLTPQTGPCFIAAGYGIPMWVYRSKEPHWDYVLNYDVYKVERWWERVHQTPNAVFNDIYKGGGWDGIGSGPGSSIEHNQEYLMILHKIIEYTPSIKTVVDIGCGDWRLMKGLSFTKKYVGVDISAHIIEQNKINYENDRIKFMVGDLLSGNLPPGDICIVKDVLQHLTNEQVAICLNNLKRYKTCVITNDYTDSPATDIQTGEWRPINILLSPFNVDGITLYGHIGKQVILLRH
jgi:hypothetical protein